MRVRVHHVLLLLLLLAGGMSRADPLQVTPAQQQAVAQTANDYLAAKDDRSYARVDAMLAPTLRATRPLPQATQELDQFNNLAGPVKERRVVQMTWYKDPPSAPLPGLYVALDIESKFENIDRHCGYVVLHEQPGGAFLVVRDEANYIDHATEQKIKAANQDVERLWAELKKNCPGSSGKL